MAEDPDHEILIEINRIGGAMEVRAISAGDGLEVSFSAPANTAQSDIQRLARAKLTYVRRKMVGETQPNTQTSDRGRKDGKGGWIA